MCFILEERYREDGMPRVVAAQLEAWGHDVDMLEPQSTATCMSSLGRFGYSLFDAYVLKTVSEGPGISLLEAAAAHGVPAINKPRAIRLVRDKAAAAALARVHSIPFPLTFFVVDPRHVEAIPLEHYPLVIKPSNGSAMKDVHRVHDPGEVEAIARACRGQASFFLAQRYVENPGYDIKLYCIGRDVYAVRRASPLHPGVLIAQELMPVAPELGRIVSRVGQVFGLDIFGVDAVLGPAGWMVVDINDFPSFGGIPAAAGLVGSAILRIASGREPGRTRSKRRPLLDRLAHVRGRPIARPGR